MVIALQQLAALVVNLVDNLMLGRYTELALSGATPVNQLQFVLQQVASAIGMGIVVLASQYWGQKRIPEIKKIISGGGSTKYPAIVDNLFMWLFTIPFSALSAFVFRFPSVITYCFLKADQLLKCIPNGITVNRFRWVKILTRSEIAAE